MVLNIIQQLCIYVVTWNVNSQFPSSSTISIHNLLGLEANNNYFRNDHTTSESCIVPDLYVIGLQEVNTQAKNIFSRLAKEEAWLSTFQGILQGGDYITIKTKRLQGIIIAVFAKRKHLLHIRDIEAEETKTGFNGLWGNKGAVSVRMNLYDSPIVFINTHLPAHDDELDKRISDYNLIIDEHQYHVNRYRQILDHDYVIWFGDLNFRLNDMSLTPQNIRGMIQEQRLNELFQHDQLSLVRQQGKAFQQFNETVPLKFAPTFKFHINSPSEYSYNMKRRPAWTDRILHRIKSDGNQFYPNLNLNIEQISYKSHPQYIISDHKPVTGEILINVLQEPIEPAIKFSNISQWNIGEENLIEYILPDNFREEDDDWIGLFPSNFNTFFDYVAYQYAIVNAKQFNKRYMNAAFADNINIVQNKEYILLYIQKHRIHSIQGVAGISNVFKAMKA